MDALSSQATAAGYKAALLAAGALPKMFPMPITAAGPITPAKVFVIVSFARHVFGRAGPEFGEEITRETLLVREGEVINRRVRELLGPPPSSGQGSAKAPPPAGNPGNNREARFSHQKI